IEDLHERRLRRVEAGEARLLALDEEDGDRADQPEPGEEREVRGRRGDAVLLLDELPRGSVDDVGHWMPPGWVRSINHPRPARRRRPRAAVRPPATSPSAARPGRRDR